METQTYSQPSRRERIMTHLQARFEAVQEGVNEHVITWNTVTRKPLGKAQIAAGDAVGLFDVSEVKTPDMGKMRCTLTVAVEFYLVLQEGDDAPTLLNLMLMDIQRTIREDIHCGGLTLNIVELRNELDVDGPAERIVAGVVEYAIQYRHAVDDPRLP